MADWAPDKLAQLRDMFGDAVGGELVDPEFRRIADLIITDGGSLRAPSAGRRPPQ